MLSKKSDDYLENVIIFSNYPLIRKQTLRLSEQQLQHLERCLPKTSLFQEKGPLIRDLLVIRKKANELQVQQPKTIFHAIQFYFSFPPCVSVSSFSHINIFGDYKKKTSDYLSNIASKSRLAITYPKPAPIPIDKPLITVITYEVKNPKLIPILLRPCITKKVVNITKVVIIDRSIKEIIVVIIIFFLSILPSYKNNLSYFNIFGGKGKNY